MVNQELTTGKKPNIQLTAEELLANTIVNKLVSQGLLPQSLAEQTFYGLCEGKLRESDWRLLAEKALDKAARGSSR
ncbi:MAG: hypothetical protein H6656_21390 [Ardenticatenaceae bacterium]|nr:hypothetical protein [Ardenticatenaceae bacterium]